jgi:hypothetical protein
LRKDPDTLEYLLNQVKEVGALGELEFGAEDPRLHSLVAFTSTESGVAYGIWIGIVLEPKDKWISRWLGSAICPTVESRNEFKADIEGYCADLDVEAWRALLDTSPYI